MCFTYVYSFGLNNIPRGLSVCVLRIFVHVQVQYLQGMVFESVVLSAICARWFGLRVHSCVLGTAKR